jgi:UPF0755 protein
MIFEKIFRYLYKKRRLIILLIFLLPVIIYDALNYFELPDHVYEAEKRVQVLIPRGASLGQISDTLLVHGLLEDPKLFRFWATTLGYDTRLKAGMFDIPENLNAVQLLEYLTHARAREIYVTLLEGWDNREIAGELSRKLSISATVFDSLCSDSSFLLQVGIDQADLTGYLLPDTYGFYWGMSEKEIIRFLVNKTRAIFKSDSIRDAMNDLKMDRHQILTMASIIEGEAIIDAERPVIASVYYNRIRKRMRLQADPTIQFIVEGPPRRLLERDLRIDSPYNTYKYYGLPPGPINNPGKASILAALFPAQTEYLYFVARGDGGHTFSRTLREHNQAKAAFDQVRRRVRRQNND